ncbi:hypothetical protein GOBAR_AA38746 [Gossypium barbadense]|uniref:Uncharacterized protein n=1 Tax=Gossypium barbadense TaxID=3634 RepID=A0A2P5VSZ9_GOSBA|nr:hypothetical protein GOBAR_AA38746 [Gossypium barbadense]
MLQGHFVELVQARSISPAKALPHTWLTKAETASLNCLARACVIGPWDSTIESLLELDALWGAIVSEADQRASSTDHELNLKSNSCPAFLCTSSWTLMIKGADASFLKLAIQFSNFSRSNLSSNISSIQLLTKGQISAD